MAASLPPIPIGTLPPPASQFRIDYAKKLLEEYLLQELSETKVPLSSFEGEVPKKIPPVAAAQPGQSDYKGRICIVGAGAAGLYLAMMLKYLGIYNVDILEATNRVGGRCYTHKFPEDKKCPHNYYDIGAMRIPDIDTQKSTLKLIEILDLEDKKKKYTYSLGDNDGPPNMYFYKSDGGPSQGKFDTAIEHIATEFQTNFEEAFDRVKKEYDLFSTRGWLMTQPKPCDNRLTYLQTVEAESAVTSTGLFDQAFLESLCDYTDFQAAKKKDWFRIDGGMSVLTDAMEESLLKKFWPHEKPDGPQIKVTRETSVISMAKEKDGDKIQVTSSDKSGKTKTETYDMVFSTTAMAPLQRMDLEGLGLPNEILTGIRTLSYDRATKVAIKFKTPWWDSFYKKPDDFGGISSSDLPISNVVYPSWRDGEENHAVLMVSYSWAQDATRMGALVPDYSRMAPSRDEPLVTLCLRNLAKLWSSQPNAPTFEFLYDQYETHHAWAWSHDPYTGGAFALFGPGQFSNIYPMFQRNFCGNTLALCGEALSVHHAWISGALDSAYAALLRWLCGGKRCAESSLLKESKFGGGKGCHPDEVKEVLVMGAVELTKKMANVNP